MDSQTRSLEEIKGEMLRRAGRINPFEKADKQDVEEVVSRLESLDPDHWGAEWARLGARFEAQGQKHEKAEKWSEAGEAYYKAYEYYRIGRYPVPSSPEKMKCYDGALRNYLKAARYLDPRAERVEIPFEGKKVVGYLQVPRGVDCPPVVMHWGGVDGWKEDSRTQSEALHRLGLATFVIDMPGAGENPLLAHDLNAERTFSAAIDHLEKRPDVDGKRIAVMGRSFGGYWATKLAYVEARRLRGAVNWGAGAHYTFQESWLRRALTETASQYLMGPSSLLEARAYIFRAKSLEEVLQIAPRLSLKTQGFLDKPNAPLLLINGKKDDQHPVEDIYLLMEHGDPKEVRLFPEAGHMGRIPGKPNSEVLEIVSRWLKQKLTR
ncbi:MAG: alpha/beta fold hydrolase [Deltaproteobacteria bacterium]|nr:alpha/beta fold hydrolase [Deltaproteobacteria bacterium]